jgi:hypothetical protein
MVEKPGRWFSIFELDGLTRGIPIVQCGPVGPEIDATAVKQYKDRFHQLEAEIEEMKALEDEAQRDGDASSAERHRAIRETLEDERAQILGEMGVRQEPADVRNIRTNVRHAVDTAFNNITDKLTAVGEHLRANIATGIYCAYTPDPAWRFDIAV